MQLTWTIFFPSGIVPDVCDNMGMALELNTRHSRREKEMCCCLISLHVASLLPLSHTLSQNLAPRLPRAPRVISHLRNHTQMTQRAEEKRERERSTTQEHYKHLSLIFFGTRHHCVRTHFACAYDTRGKMNGLLFYKVRTPGRTCRSSVRLPGASCVVLFLLVLEMRYCLCSEIQQIVGSY
jgi:hypothetical protein